MKTIESLAFLSNFNALRTEFFLFAYKNFWVFVFAWYWYKVFGKKMFYSPFSEKLQIRYDGPMVLILGRLCAFNQAWKPSLKVGGLKIHF